MGKNIIIKGADFSQNAIDDGNPDYLFSDFTSMGNYHIDQDSHKIVTGNSQYPQAAYYVAYTAPCRFTIKISEAKLIRWGTFASVPATNAVPLESYLDSSYGDSVEISVNVSTGSYFMFSVSTSASITSVEGYRG